MADMTDVKAMLADINRALGDDDLELGTWETDFLESIRWKADHGEPLSDRQDGVLTRIWKKATNRE